MARATQKKIRRRQRVPIAPASKADGKKARITEAQSLIRSLLDKGRTIEEFAPTIGADRRSVARWRSGQTAPHPTLLDALRKQDSLTPTPKTDL